MAEPIVDRAFVEKFMLAVDRPLEYGVYYLFHDWWQGAPQDAIDAYADALAKVPGVQEFVAERWLAEPLDMDALAACAPGTLGHEYRRYIVDNNLLADLARDYRAFHGQLKAAGTLDRLPDDLGYMIVRGFQIHDFLHVITGHNSTPLGELGMAAFHFGQLQFPYHAMRMAVTFGHMAFVDPKITVPVMDVICRGWMLGRETPNLHFTRWEERLHDSLDSIRAELELIPVANAA